MSERAGAKTTEVPGSHVIYDSNPKAVADLIGYKSSFPFKAGVGSGVEIRSRP
jgi:hypothetical protein